MHCHIRQAHPVRQGAPQAKEASQASVSLSLRQGAARGPRRPRAIAWLAGLLALGLAACTSSPPDQVANACGIFEEKRSWYKAMKRAEDRWGLPVGVNLAFIRQESSFEAKARPDRKRILGIIPGPRPSSAYGYAQATTPTWEDYQRDVRRPGADRDDFSDAVDFVGWYTSRASRTLGLSQSDAYRQYLAYHEGFGGYRSGSYRNKAWLQKAARRVANNASVYERQLAGCERSLNRSRFLFF
ncbi:MAG: hypothetical protein AAGH45_00120 [Pseudomonadota bacterium]